MAALQAAVAQAAPGAGLTVDTSQISTVAITEVPTKVPTGAPTPSPTRLHVDDAGAIDLIGARAGAGAGLAASGVYALAGATGALLLLAACVFRAGRRSSAFNRALIKPKAGIAEESDRGLEARMPNPNWPAPSKPSGRLGHYSKQGSAI